MIPDLNYYTPVSVSEAVELLHNNRNAKILAGGTDVVGGIRIGSSRFKKVTGLVDINGIDEFRGITETDETVTIGANTTFTEITKNEICRKLYPALVSAASQVGSPQIRNRATIAGNFVNNATPSTTCARCKAATRRR